MLLYGNELNKDWDLFYFWHSSQKFDPGINLALYQNAKVDSLIENLQEESDQEKRKGDLREVATLIKEDYPAIFLFSQDYFHHIQLLSH